MHELISLCIKNSMGHHSCLCRSLFTCDDKTVCATVHPVNDTLLGKPREQRCQSTFHSCSRRVPMCHPRVTYVSLSSGMSLQRECDLMGVWPATIEWLPGHTMVAQRVRATDDHKIPQRLESWLSLVHVHRDEMIPLLTTLT